MKSSVVCAPISPLPTAWSHSSVGTICWQPPLGSAARPANQSLINPLGLLFEEITASPLVRVSLDGEILDGGASEINPAGFTIHSAVHAARPEVQCVMHLHTVSGVAVSSQEHGLLPINQSAMLMNGRLGTTTSRASRLDLDERPRLVADLADNDAMILRNHGTLSVGTSSPTPSKRCTSSSGRARYRLPPSPAGPRSGCPTKRSVGIVDEQVADFGDIADRLLWPALLRRLDRQNPGYRD